MKKPIDLAGKRFGKLLALKVSETRNRGVLSWDCICDCGNSKVVASVDLRKGHAKSCGCMQYKGTPKDIAGKRFGKLTAEYRLNETSSNGDYLWGCKCDCGNKCVTTIGRLNFGKTISCGCAVNDAAQERRKYTPEISKSKVLRTWAKMKERCYNKNSIDYPNYGGKGVVIHDSFLSDFMNFYNEIGDPPDDGRMWSVDRIDHKKNYEPGNVRWATDTQQARNKGKMRNNTSGATGVSWDNKPWSDGSKKLYAKAQWKFYDASGKQHNGTKSFSVEKLGLLPAFALAVQYREQKIKELNALGYGYSENHGK